MDRAASAAEFSGCRSSATAHISSPNAAAKPSTNHAPDSGTGVRSWPSSISSRSESSSTLPRIVPLVPCTQKGQPGFDDTTLPTMRKDAVAPPRVAKESVADHGLRASAGWPGTRESTARTDVTRPSSPTVPSASHVRVMSTQCRR